jgi:hypothetical protein
MNVIKGLISTGSSGDDDDIAAKDVTTVARDVRHRLQCVVTAFELLSGQGTLSFVFFSHSHQVIGSSSDILTWHRGSPEH